LKAGLPAGSVVGSTLRRLLISLARYPKVNKIVFIKNFDNNDVLNKDEEVLLQSIEKLNEIDEIIRKRGRFHEYPGILDFIKIIESRKISVEAVKVEKLRSLKDRMLENTYKDFELPPQTYKTLSYKPKLHKPLIPTLDFYIKPNKSDLYCTRTFSSIHEAYEHCIKLVKFFGTLDPDGSGLRRYEIKDVDRIRLAIEKYEDLEEFLRECGVDKELKEVEQMFGITGKFGMNISDEDIDQLEEYIKSIVDCVNSERLNFSRELIFTTKKDTVYGNVQIGWFRSKATLKKVNDEIIITFGHSLRSVDVHDGLPYNFYFCIKLSEYIIREVRERTGKKVKLSTMFFSLGSLHAYWDNLGDENDSDQDH